MTALNKKNINIIYRIIILSVITTLIAVFLTSCITFKINIPHGSGNVISETRDVVNFKEVSLEGIGNLTIEQGNIESLTIQAEDNVMPQIKSEVNNGILHISFKKPFLNVIPTKDINFNLKVKNLTNINLSGAANIVSNNLTTDQLKIVTSGAGKIKLTVNANNLDINLSGAGSIELSGKVSTQKIIISGAGNYQAKNLESKNCIVIVSGVGSAVINAIESLDVTISGVGNVNYTGNPKISQQINGVGKINNVSD
jgi:hypothetical protein